MWCYACSWDVKGNLILNSMAQIHTSVTLLMSRDLMWNSGQLTRQHTSHFCCRTHFVRRDLRVECSSDVVISCLQKWRKCSLKKCANRHDTTQQSGQTPDKGVEIKNIMFMTAATLKPIWLESYLPQLPGAKSSHEITWCDNMRVPPHMTWAQVR